MRRTSAFRPEVRRALPVLVALRFVTNTGGRMIFSFLPAIRQGAGLSVEEMGRVLFARDMTGLVSLFIGHRIDRFGKLRAVTYGSLLAGLGLILATFGALGVFIGLVLFGLGRLAVQIGMNSWIADEVAYERRGQATGLIELTWSGAALIGIPLCGLLIDLFGWRAPFVALGVLSLVFGLQQGRTATSASYDEGPQSDPIPVIVDRSMVATLFAPALLGGASGFMFFGHGLWLEDEFGLDSLEIGLAVIALGLAEALGSFGSSRITDRIGKRRSMISGSLVMIAALISLSVINAPSLVVGLGLLVIAYLGFEFAIVSSLPLVAELSTTARARMIGWSVGLSTVCRAAASLFAGWLLEREPFSVAVAVAAGVAAVAVGAMMAITEPESNPGA